MSKRGTSPAGDGQLVKRSRSNTPPRTQLVISSSGDDRQKGLVRTVKRTSNLEAPIISLSGAHSVSGVNVRALLGDSRISCQGRDSKLSIRSYGTKYCRLFSRPKRLCVLSFLVRAHTDPLDHHSFFSGRTALWRTYSPNTNYGLLSSLHKAPILDLHWSLCSPTLYTVSADHTLSFTDVTTGQRVKKIRAHRGIINALDRTMAGGAGMELIATGSDDGSVRVWEGDGEGSKQSVAVWEVGCPVTGVCWSADGQHVYVAAMDNEIHVRILFCLCLKQLVPQAEMGYCAQVYDVRKNQEVYTLTGHTDTPTSLALSPNGSYLLSPSFSSQTIVHDVRPFSPSPSRIHRVLQGAPAGFENTLLKGAWSKDDEGRRVAVGGADRMVCIWDVESGRVLYKVCSCLVSGERLTKAHTRSFLDTRGP